MADTDMKHVVLVALVVLVVLFGVYQYDHTLMGVLPMLGVEGFEDKTADKKADKKEEKKKEKFEDKKDKFEDKKDKFEDKKEKFEDKKDKKEEKKAKFQDMADEGFADLSAYQGPAQFGSAEAPAGCYPRDQLTPSELLPKDMNSVWAEQNPMGAGSLKGKNFLSAGALIGVNTVGQSMRNANLQVRSEPPNPQVAVSIFNQSTISPDISHRPLEIGA
jgi:hypothetical protein